MPARPPPLATLALALFAALAACADEGHGSDVSRSRRAAKSGSHADDDDRRSGDDGGGRRANGANAGDESAGRANGAANAGDESASRTNAIDGGRGTARSNDGGAGPHIARGSRPLMGTIFEIQAVAPDGAETTAAFEAAFDEVARLEDMMSEWKPDSQVSRVNAAAGRAPVVVDRELLDVVKESLRIASVSRGKFDITWAALRGLWDFNAADPRPPSRAEALRRARFVRWQDLVVDEAAGTLFLRRRGMAIGLGGIAKGYALDKAAAILEARGLHHFVIYGGGQVLLRGTKGERPWRVGIQHPRRPGVTFAYFSPGAGSVATSGDYEHAFVHDGVRYHHIIDPATGYPSSASVAVTVFAPTGFAADAIDTALFILGPDEGQRLARTEHVEALFIDPGMNIVTTRGFQRRITFVTPLEAPGSGHPDD